MQKQQKRRKVSVPLKLVFFPANTNSSTETHKNKTDDEEKKMRKKRWWWGSPNHRLWRWLTHRLPDELISGKTFKHVLIGDKEAFWSPPVVQVEVAGCKLLRVTQITQIINYSEMFPICRWKKATWAGARNTNLPAAGSSQATPPL